MAINLPPRGRHLRRYRQILTVLARHGFGWFLGQLGLGGALLPPWATRPSVPEGEATQPERLRHALEELGATFVKLGQLLSTRADLLPPAYIAELAKLQDAVAPEPFGSIRRTIASELEQDLGEAFASFEEAPLAAASIGQVHAATLRDGREVVVKVQRAGVAAQVETDLDILLDLAHLAVENSALGRRYDLVGLAQQFAHTLRGELDYRREGRNADRFRRNFEDDPSFRIPEVVWSLTTDRVLTLERVRGIKISDLPALDAAGIDRHALAARSARAVVKQMFVDGFFHADPHPGNFFVLADGSIAAVDFGMVGRLDDATRDHLLSLLVAGVNRDTRRVVDGLVDLGVASGRVDRVALQHELDDLIDEYYGVSLRELDLSRLLGQALRVMQRHRLQLPVNLSLLAKTLVMNEGVGRELDPEFRLIEVAEPFARQAIGGVSAPTWLAARAGQSLREWGALGLEAPARARRLLSQIERGELELTVTLAAMDRVARRFERMVNRLALSILTAGFIVGLAILTLAYQPPGWSILSRALFVAGSFAVSVLGIWLVLSLFTSRRE